ncbi:MAG: SGNH/GDSL hydrolase family protein [Aquabacterium sp.]
MILRTQWFAASLAITAAATMAPGAAFAYDELVVFGDSLSDNGNFYNAIFRIAPSKPYYEGRFSSGPVAVEVMAGLLGIPLVDQAFGGASSGIDNRYLPGTGTGLRGQVDSYLTKLSAAGKAADPADLYVLWGGGNDLLDEITEGRGDAIPTVIDTTVSNLAGSVSALYQAGARDLLLPLMPDMATSFYGTSGQYATTFLSQVSASFNDALRARMAEVAQASPGLTLRIFDTPAVLQGRSHPDCSQWRQCGGPLLERRVHRSRHAVR